MEKITVVFDVTHKGEVTGISHPLPDRGQLVLLLTSAIWQAYVENTESYERELGN